LAIDAQSLMCKSRVLLISYNNVLDLHIYHISAILNFTTDTIAVRLQFMLILQLSFLAGDLTTTLVTWVRWSMLGHQTSLLLWQQQ